MPLVVICMHLTETETTLVLAMSMSEVGNMATFEEDRAHFVR